MSWIPTFDLGFWNAWILTLFMVLHPIILNFVDKAIGTGYITKKMGDVPAEDGDKRAFPIPTMLLIVLFIYSIFLPLKPGTLWLYCGIGIYIIGLVIFMTAVITVAKTPMSQIFSQGVYRYSRHPLYLSFIIIFVRISVASPSWLFLLLSMGWMMFPISQVTSEEQGCLDTFGVEYQEYMRRTPKWLGVPKSKV